MGVPFDARQEHRVPSTTLAALASVGMTIWVEMGEFG